MNKEIKKGEKLEDKKYNKNNVINISVSRFAIIAETEKNVLVNITKQYAIWFNKKWVRCSNYTLRASIGVCLDNEYLAVSKEGEKVSFTGEQIAEYFKNKKDEYKKDEEVEAIEKDLEK